MVVVLVGGCRRRLFCVYVLMYDRFTGEMRATNMPMNRRVFCGAAYVVINAEVTPEFKLSYK
jgi:hypothetical protein